MLMAMLRSAVAADPAKIALVCGDERISYAELEQRVARCAGGLRGLGVKEGDCVATVLANGPPFVIAFLATAALRAIFLPLNPNYTKAELQRFIADAEPRVVIAGGGEPAGATPFTELQGPEQRQDHGPFAGRALYLYTSGSTDTYKRVCCTQENLYYEALNFVETVSLTKDDTILCAIPLFHSYGLGNCLLDALYVGATLVILDPAESDGGEAPFVNRCARLAELIRTEKVRFYPGVPYQFSVLASLPEQFPIDFSGVRLCISSGDVLPSRTYGRFLARFGQPIRSLYGSTEAGSIAIDLSPPDMLQTESVGRPLRNVAIEIREGEIWVKSPTLPPGGYDNRPALSTETFRDGFYKTGDLGALDADGRLRITGRKQSFVDIAGYKVDIAEVEEVLSHCPGVEEAAALGVVIESMGALIKAVVVPKDGWRENDIRAFCRKQLAFVKVPRIIELRPTLPRSSIGKILKSELADVSAYLATIREAKTSHWLRQLPTAGPEQRARLLRNIVQAQAAAVLGRSPAETPDDRGFTDLGMDSFASIELRARLEYLLERQLPETMTFDHPTVVDVVAFLERLQ